MDNNNHNNHPNRGPLLRVIGQCSTNERYSHDYLNCTKCNVDKNKLCNIKKCPCNGEGHLFQIDNEDDIFSHQIPGQLNSVRIYNNRPKRAIKAVEKSIEKHNRIVSKEYSHMRHRTTITKRVENGTIHRRGKKKKKNSTQTTMYLPSSPILCMESQLENQINKSEEEFSIQQLVGQNKISPICSSKIDSSSKLNFSDAFNQTINNDNNQISNITKEFSVEYQDSASQIGEASTQKEPTTPIENIYINFDDICDISFPTLNSEEV